MHNSALSRLILFGLVAMLLLAVSAPSFGQKKKRDSSPSPSAMQATPGDVPLHFGSKQGATLHEVLAKIIGQHTNVGQLAKVTADYLMFESDGDTLVYPIEAVHSVRFMKVEEGEPRKIEIKFSAKD